jgi:hypothetical protein
MSFTSRLQAIRLHNHQLDELHLNLWTQKFDPARVSKTLEDVELGCASISQVWSASDEGSQKSHLPPEIDLKIRPRYVIESRDQYCREVERKAGQGNFLRPRDAYVIERVICKLYAGNRIYLHVRMKDCYQYLMPLNIAQSYLKEHALNDFRDEGQSSYSSEEKMKLNQEKDLYKTPSYRRKLGEISGNSAFSEFKRRQKL